MSFARSPRSPSLTGGALAVAFLLLGGAHQLAVYGALGLGLICLPLMCGRADRMRWIGFALATALLGLLIGAPGWLPQVAYLQESSRAEGLDAASVLAGTIGSLGDIARALIGPSTDAGTSVSVGAFALIVAGIVPRDREKRQLWIGAWIAVLVTAMLAWEPVIRALLAFAPAIGFFHGPLRILGVTQWMMILAAAFAADDCLDSFRGKRPGSWLRALPGIAILGMILALHWSRLSGFGIASAGLAAAFVLFTLLTLSAASPLRLGPARIALATILAGALILLSVETWRSLEIGWVRVSRLIGDGPPRLLAEADLQPGERFFTVDWKRDTSYDYRRPDLRESALPNLAMLWGLEDLGGYEAARSPRYDRWLHSVAPWPADRPPWRKHFALPFPPHPQSPNYLRFLEANPRAALLPRWGVPIYLHTMSTDASFGLLPDWPDTLTLRLLHAPDGRTDASRNLHLLTATGRTRGLAFDSEAAVPAGAPAILTDPPEASDETSAFDPRLQIQAFRLEPAWPESPYPGFELQLPPDEFPAWAFLWSETFERGYVPRAEAGLHALALIPADSAWAVVRGPDAADGSGEILAKKIGANRITLDVRLPGAQPGVLEIRDAWWPGWSAWVEGNPVEVRPSGPDRSGPWRQVELPPGDSRVVMTYRPPLLDISLALSGAGLLALLALGWMLDRRAVSASAAGAADGAASSF
jgi:hypothetical protein